MKRVGDLSNGRVLVEMSQNEWLDYYLRQPAYSGPDSLSVQARKKYCLSQEQLALLAGTSSKSISLIELGADINDSHFIHERIESLLVALSKGPGESARASE